MAPAYRKRCETPSFEGVPLEFGVGRPLLACLAGEAVWAANNKRTFSSSTPASLLAGEAVWAATAAPFSRPNSFTCQTSWQGSRSQGIVGSLALQTYSPASQDGRGRAQTKLCGQPYILVQSY